MAECTASVVSRDDLKIVFNDLCKEFIIESCGVLTEELEKKREWTRKWLLRRESHGASSLILKEFRFEDPSEYRACLRMSPESFDELFNLVEQRITKQDTVMRESLPAKLKLEVTISFLATGNSYRSLSHFFRVSKSAISRFIPEVCEALYTSLEDYLKVSKNLN